MYKNKKSPKKLVTVVILLILSLVIINIFIANKVCAKEIIPTATDQFYVNDFAGILSSEENDTLMNRAVALAEKPEGVQVVVSTVNSLMGLSIEDFANNMYNKYEIGLEDRGILILLSIKERVVRVEVGYGLESVITDSKAGKLIDNNAIPDFKKNSFGPGLVKLQKAIIDEIEAYYSAPAATTTKSTPVSTDEIKQSSKDNAMTNIVITLIATFFTCFFVFLIFYKRKKKAFKNKCTDLKDDYDYRLEEQNKRNQRDISDFQERISSINNEKKNLSKKYDSLKSSLSSLQSKYDELQERIAYAKEIHPDLDDEIDLHIAEKFDSRFSHLACTVAAIESISMFKECLDAYDALTSNQQTYVSTNMNTIRGRYDESCHLKDVQEALEFDKRANEKIGSSRRGSEKMLHTLEPLEREYNNLPKKVQMLVTADVVSRMNSLISDGRKEQKAREEAEEAERRRREAERRRRQEEEDEERRRRSYSHHSSSSSFHHSSSSFGGFGGHSGGGGASRGF